MHATSTSTPLTIGKLLGLTIGLYRTHSGVFLRTAAIFYLPVAALSFFFRRESRYQHPLFSANLAHRSNRELVAHFPLRRIVARASSCRQDSGQAWSASPAG